jgi:O-antigen/teichoic acid export membrane protein
LTMWSLTYLAAAIIASVIALGVALTQLGTPRLRVTQIKGQMWEGFYFATSLAAQTVYNDIDKTMLARLSTLEAVGIYGASYRIVNLAFVPVTALLSAAYPHFFRHGKAGLPASLQYGRHLLRQTLPYSVGAAVVLIITAPGLPRILGAQYAHVTEALRWLALLPVLKTLHYSIANSLTGAGYQRHRTLCQAGVAVFNILVNWWIIPAYGWRGAAWSSLASDSLLVLLLWITASRLSRNSPTAYREGVSDAVNSSA